MGILISSSERRRRDLFLAVVFFSSFFGGHPVAAVPTAAVYAFTNKVGISFVIYVNRSAEHALASDFQSGEGGCDICFHFSCVVGLGPLPHARKAWGNGLFWLIQITENQSSGKITSPTPYVRSRCRDLRADLQRNRWRASHPGGCIHHWHGEPFLQPPRCPCPSRRHRTSRRALRD